MARFWDWVDEHERYDPGFLLKLLIFVPGPVAAVCWQVGSLVWSGGW